MNSTYKNCPQCNSNKVVKNGFQYGRRRYKCKECGKQFQNKKVVSREHSVILETLVSKKNLTQN
jgi:transposase-like protein